MSQLLTHSSDGICLERMRLASFHGIRTYTEKDLYSEFVTWCGYLREVGDYSRTLFIFHYGKKIFITKKF